MIEWRAERRAETRRGRAEQSTQTRGASERVFVCRRHASLVFYSGRGYSSLGRASMHTCLRASSIQHGDARGRASTFSALPMILLCAAQVPLLPSSCTVPRTQHRDRRGNHPTRTDCNCSLRSSHPIPSYPIPSMYIPRPLYFAHPHAHSHAGAEMLRLANGQLTLDHMVNRPVVHTSIRPPIYPSVRPSQTLAQHRVTSHSSWTVSGSPHLQGAPAAQPPDAPSTRGQPA